jgi:hypothetical protein
MRPPLTAILFFAASALSAQPVAPAAQESSVGVSPREAALEHLLSERGSPEELAAAIEQAKTVGIGEQAVLEARFLYHVDRQEDDALAAMLPEFLARRDRFRLEDSEIFSLNEDWLAVVEYVQAIAALNKGDKAGFKRHITEAFWLSPRQGAAFAPHIDRLRLQEAMDAVRIDFSVRLADLTGDAVVGLEELMKDKKAGIFFFWTPWSHECEAALPDYVAMAIALEQQGIAAVALVQDDSPKTLTDARTMIRPLGAMPPGAWLVDRRKDPLSRMLRVQSVPTLVVFSTEGRVLFNGHPADDALWKTLRKIDESIVPPAGALSDER